MITIEDPPSSMTLGDGPPYYTHKDGTTQLVSDPGAEFKFVEPVHPIRRALVLLTLTVGSWALLAWMVMWIWKVL